MDGILGRIAAYVTSKDSRLACAAAVVLAELAPKEPGLVARLSEALENGDPLRRQFIIEALGRIGTAEAAEVLVPLIKSQGPSSEQALRAIAHTASAALKPLLKLLGSIPPALLERVAECAARTGEPAAFNGLIAHLATADVDACRAVRGGLRMAMTSFAEKPKSELRRALEKGFDNDTLTEHVPGLIGLMKIAGDLGDVALLKPILKRTEPSFPPHVRRAALLAIGMLHLPGDQRAKLAPKLLPLMLDADTSNIAEPALEALRQASLDSSHQSALRKLLNSPAPGIREFAMQVLARHGSARTIHDLIACLDNPDRSVKDEALSALSRAPSAAGPLAERLIGIDSGEAALETARTLAPQASHIPSRLLVVLAQKYLKWSEAAQSNPAAAEKQRAVLTVFRGAQSPALVEAVYAHAKKLRQKDEALRAHEMLKAISGLTGWGSDQKIELALAGLSFGAKDFTRTARGQDFNLRLLEEVFAAGGKPKDVLRAVVKGGELSRKTVYYIGFHFVERTNAEREFGRLLLLELMKGRSDEAREAKEKLVIEGLLKAASTKSGILEARAQIMMAPADLNARLKARQDIRAARKSVRGKKPLKPRPGKSKKARAR